VLLYFFSNVVAHWPYNDRSLPACCQNQSMPWKQRTNQDPFCVADTITWKPVPLILSFSPRQPVKTMRLPVAATLLCLASSLVWSCNGFSIVSSFTRSDGSVSERRLSSSSSSSLSMMFDQLTEAISSVAQKLGPQKRYA